MHLNLEDFARQYYLDRLREAENNRLVRQYYLSGPGLTWDRRLLFQLGSWMKRQGESLMRRAGTGKQSGTYSLNRKARAHH